MVRLMNSNHFTTKQSGFTLIEALVSIALFVIVATMAISALLTVDSANKRAQATRALVADVGYMFEDMVRTAQDGTGYGCGTRCDITPASTLIFTDSNGDTVRYTLTSGALTKQVGTNAAESITPPNITVQQLAFYVTQSSDSTLQPRILAIMKAQIGGKYANTITLQTSITQK